MTALLTVVESHFQNEGETGTMRSINDWENGITR
jgi:hypothetical protein